MSWQSCVVNKEVTIKEVVSILENERLRIAVIVNENSEVMGTITDGDVRRGLLKGISLENKAIAIMNDKPYISKKNEITDHFINEIKSKGIKQLPIIDNNNIIENIMMIDDIDSSNLSNIAVIMAGGLGKRLLPLTKERPKALVKVGGKPIIGILIEQLRDSGFKEIYISLNYKAEMIRNEIGNGEKYNVTIHYIEETKKLGTGGALSYLKGNKIAEPFLCINCDILTNVNFSKALSYHIEEKAMATMCVRKYEIQVPYGVVEIINNKIKKINEKPLHKFFVNAGIYNDGTGN